MFSGKPIEPRTLPRTPRPTNPRLPLGSSASGPRATVAGGRIAGGLGCLTDGVEATVVGADQEEALGGEDRRRVDVAADLVDPPQPASRRERVDVVVLGAEVDVAARVHQRPRGDAGLLGLVEADREVP